MGSTPVVTSGATVEQAEPVPLKDKNKSNWDEGYFKGLLRESDGTPSFARTGSLLVLAAVIGWISYVVHKTHAIPVLGDVKNFLTGSFVCLYGVNKTSSLVGQLGGQAASFFSGLRDAQSAPDPVQNVPPSS